MKNIIINKKVLAFLFTTSSLGAMEDSLFSTPQQPQHPTDVSSTEEEPEPVATDYSSLFSPSSDKIIFYKDGLPQKNPGSMRTLKNKVEWKEKDQYNLWLLIKTGHNKHLEFYHPGPDIKGDIRPSYLRSGFYLLLPNLSWDLFDDVKDFKQEGTTFSFQGYEDKVLKYTMTGRIESQGIKRIEIYNIKKGDSEEKKILSLFFQLPCNYLSKTGSFFCSLKITDVGKNQLCFDYKSNACYFWNYNTRPIYETLPENSPAQYPVERTITTLTLPPPQDSTSSVSPSSDKIIFYKDSLPKKNQNSMRTLKNKVKWQEKDQYNLWLLIKNGSNKYLEFYHPGPDIKGDIRRSYLSTGFHLLLPNLSWNLFDKVKDFKQEGKTFSFQGYEDKVLKYTMTGRIESWGIGGVIKIANVKKWGNQESKILSLLFQIPRNYKTRTGSFSCSLKITDVGKNQLCFDDKSNACYFWNKNKRPISETLPENPPAKRVHLSPTLENTDKDEKIARLDAENNNLKNLLIQGDKDIEEKNKEIAEKNKEIEDLIKESTDKINQANSSIFSYYNLLNTQQKEIDELKAALARYELKNPK